MTEIWPDYVAQAFLPPPGLNRQFQDVGSDRVNNKIQAQVELCQAKGKHRLTKLGLF